MWFLLAITQLWNYRLSTDPWNSGVPQKALFQTIYRLKPCSNRYTANLSSNNHRWGSSRYSPVSLHTSSQYLQCYLAKYSLSSFQGLEWGSNKTKEQVRENLRGKGFHLICKYPMFASSSVTDGPETTFSAFLLAAPKPWPYAYTRPHQ